MLRRGGGGCGVSANEYGCAHVAQVNFEDLTQYLTYDCCGQGAPNRHWSEGTGWGTQRSTQFLRGLTSGSLHTEIGFLLPKPYFNALSSLQNLTVTTYVG